MSETEIVTGKLEVFPRNYRETDTEYILRFMKLSGEYDVKTLLEDGSEQDIKEFFSDQFYEKAIIHKNIIYHIYDTKFYNEESNIFESYKLENGDIGFTLEYYNSSTSFSEAIEYALDKLEG